jgi:hypothetical protein
MPREKNRRFAVLRLVNEQLHGFLVTQARTHELTVAEMEAVLSAALVLYKVHMQGKGGPNALAHPREEPGDDRR